MAEIRETSYVQTADEDVGVITTNELAQINRITRLKDKYPDEVQIMHQPENNYGVLVAEVPKKWFTIRPPKVVNFTDEQKAMFAENLRANRQGNTVGK